ncbi:hypothetical protein PVAP13_1KG391805 [Panicum virgatum]|uniref:Uncharacterized protein n=1 Tax=Panicum virgatum TaxID=38727 RepID=A0A8T0XKN4_PANVG|nr:hypothetical protein PVAP13_1KG391805 [Panicum virgatum]
MAGSQGHERISENSKRSLPLAVSFTGRASCPPTTTPADTSTTAKRVRHGLSRAPLLGRRLNKRARSCHVLTPDAPERTRPPRETEEEILVLPNARVQLERVSW